MAEFLVNAVPGSDRPSGTTKRLWRSNFSVAVPLCGGIAITTLSAPALEISTSQNWRALFAPRPRSDEHVTVVRRPARRLGAALIGVQDRRAARRRRSRV